MLNGPQSLKLQRIGKRLVNVENTVAEFMLLVDTVMNGSFTQQQRARGELRELRARFEGRKKIGIRKKKT